MRSKSNNRVKRLTRNDDLEEPLISPTEREEAQDSAANANSGSNRRRGHEENDGDNTASNIPSPDSSQAQVPSLSRFFEIGRPELSMVLLAACLMVLNETSGLIIPRIVGQAYDALVDPSLDAANKSSTIAHAMALYSSSTPPVS